jgi:hypothetical protein
MSSCTRESWPFSQAAAWRPATRSVPLAWFDARHQPLLLGQLRAAHLPLLQVRPLRERPGSVGPGHAAIALREHAAHRQAARQKGLPLHDRHRRPGHRVDPQLAVGGGQAVFRLLGFRGVPCTAPRAPRLDRQVPGQVRSGLGQGARGDVRAAAATGRGAGQCQADAAAGDGRTG